MVKTSKIMVVDDEADIREIVTLSLRHDNYEIVEASSAEEALELLDAGFSLIILDVMMDGMNGFEMAEKIRKEGNLVPIIFLTAKVDESDALKGFSVGGDDYIRKPFSTRELSARVKSIITRSELPSVVTSDLTIAGVMDIDSENKRVMVKGEQINLTRTEYDILLLLIKNEGRTLTRVEILNTVWAENKTVMERTVDVHIARLRRKLGSYAWMVNNRVGYGYSFRRVPLSTDTNIDTLL